MVDDVSTLSLLSSSERQILLLLAEGHTAKSIASSMGLSVHTVNERLREARRKVGAGSSRELARQLRAQETWDKQIGVPKGDEGNHLGSTPTRWAIGSVQKGLIVMTIIAFVAAGVLVLGLQEKRLSPDADPVLSGLLANRENEPRDLYAQVRTEKRDASWAPIAEAVLRERYGSLAGGRE